MKIPHQSENQLMQDGLLQIFKQLFQSITQILWKNLLLLNLKAYLYTDNRKFVKDLYNNLFDSLDILINYKPLRYI
ncbi:unnamed protein product (macronuclear) [Paramecium tetraurelia]|uniref:Uncharacterized protein n=1 Tax=Paramecium tetraurelia TaxID=5888 RepID=A0CBN5_PARTE|nr:uncharacterized protein GSPATT00036985001 [Paramecium tetraurelia]CAK68202.1 unnamed protein product [Paramecium tetraurelia]|eukprot:XP_001435599.1 hypothetical protein (macronuclear) [Paramecium tetraurelia strain d4-2]